MVVIASVLSSAAAAWFLLQDDKQKLHAYIPESAQVIIKPDFGFLTSIIRQDELDKYNKTGSDSNQFASFLRMLLASKTASGIETKHDFYITLHQGEYGLKTLFFFELSDNRAFEQVVKKWLNGRAGLKTAGNIQSVQLNPGLHIAWNSDFAVFGNLYNEQISPVAILDKRVKGSAGNLYLREMTGGNRQNNISIKPGGMSALAGLKVISEKNRWFPLAMTVLESDPYGRTGRVEFTTGRAVVKLNSVNKPVQGKPLFKPVSESADVTPPANLLFYLNTAFNADYFSKITDDRELGSLLSGFDGKAEMMFSGESNLFVAEIGVKNDTLQSLLSPLLSLANTEFSGVQGNKASKLSMVSKPGKLRFTYGEKQSADGSDQLPSLKPPFPFFLSMHVSELADKLDPEEVPKSLRQAGLNIKVGLSDVDLEAELLFNGGNRNSLSLIYELILNVDKEMKEIIKLRSRRKDTTIYIPTIENSEY